MDEKQLKQLAIDIAENKVFGTFHMRQDEMNMVYSVFMPLIFIKSEERQKMEDDNIIHFYEHYDKAGPRSINGMPTFFSFWMISKDNWAKVRKYIKEYEVKVKVFLNKDSVKQKLEEPTLFDAETANEDN